MKRSGASTVSSSSRIDAPSAVWMRADLAGACPTARGPSTPLIGGNGPHHRENDRRQRRGQGERVRLLDGERDGPRLRETRGSAMPDGRTRSGQRRSGAPRPAGAGAQRLLLERVQVVVDGEAGDAEHLGDVLHRAAQGERAELVEATDELLLLLAVELAGGLAELALDGGDHAVEGTVEARRTEAADQLALPRQLDVAGPHLGRRHHLRADGLGHRLHGGEQRMSGGTGHRREATAGADIG